MFKSKNDRHKNWEVLDKITRSRENRSKDNLIVIFCKNDLPYYEVSETIDIEYSRATE